MEGVAAAASIVQLLDVALRTTEALIRYGNDTKNASKEKKTLVEETLSLAAILRSLRDYAQRNSQDPTWLESHKDIVLQFQRAYQDLAISLQLDIDTGQQKPESKFQAIRAAAKWSFNKSEVYALVERVTRLQQYANTMMISDQGLMLQNIGQQQQREIERNLKKAVSNWLSPLQMNHFHQSVVEQAQLGSGRWFLASEQFVDWQTGRSSLLWCPGMPGAGKTVIASLVVEHLRRYAKEDSSDAKIGIGFIYLKYNDPSQTLCNILASLLNQLALELPRLPDHLRELYERCQDLNTVPNLTDISQALTTSIKELTEIYLVIDALDECVDEVRWGMVEQLRKLSDGQPKVRILTLSRYLGGIAELLEDFESLEIKAHKEDVELFIDAQIQRNPNLRRVVEKSARLRGDIKEAVLRTAKDMFLLARLHIDSLISAAALSIKHIRKKLNTLPTTLDATYDEAIQRITSQDPDHKEIAFKALAWVSYTFRPLKLKELQHALAIEPGATELDEEMIMEAHSITALCAGILLIDAVNDDVNLVHYTANRYLEDRRSLFFPSFHGQITTSCAAYLAIKPLRKATIREIVSKYPLACYAAQYMGDHARHNPEETLEQSVLDAIYSLLARSDTRSPLLCLLDGLDLIRSGFYSSTYPFGLEDEDGEEVTLVEIQEDIASQLEDYSQHMIQVTSLHLAASLGLARVASMLLDETVDIDAVDESGKTALGVAIEKGFEKAVEFLIHSGARIDLETEHGQAVFLLLAEKGWDHVLRHICERAIAETTNAYGTASLLIATYIGDVQKFDHILVQEYSTSENSRLLEVVLFIAVECNHAAIVDRILSSHSIVNSKDSSGHTSLHRATRKGSEDIIKVLLKHKVKVDELNDDGRTAWSANIKSRNEHILGLLLAAGADPNTRSPNGGGSEIYSAAACGAIAQVTFMLKSGTNPSILTDFLWAPLHWAACNGHVECVKALLSAGADPSPVSDQGTTPLDLALRSDQTAVVNVLLEAGAKEAKDITKLVPSDDNISLALSDLSLQPPYSQLLPGEINVGKKVVLTFDYPLKQRTWFGQIIYPIRQHVGDQNIHEFPNLDEGAYHISHMLDSRVHTISVKRSTIRPLMADYPLDKNIFIRQNILYDISRVDSDYQELELSGPPGHALSGTIRLRKGWSGSWKAHHNDGTSTKVLFRSVPDLASGPDLRTRWVTDDGILIAKATGTLETNMIVEEGLELGLRNALVACWVAKLWSETLTMHRGRWPGESMEETWDV